MNTETINYSVQQKIPVNIQAEVIVIGGGPGGIGAAVAAARNGADTLLIERYGYLGGMASAGEVFPFMSNHLNGRTLDKPVYADWVNAMRKYSPGNDGGRDEEVETSRGCYSKDEAMLAAEDICLEAGVRLVYHHNLFDAVVKNGKIEAVVLFSKSGLSAAKAEIFIDCSGDADLAFKAGCEYEYGNDEALCQPMTLCFKVAGVDADRLPDRAEINRLYDEAKAQGEIQCLRENVLWFVTPQKDIIHFNTTRVIRKSAVDGLELSEAEIEARKQLRQYLEFFREHVSGYENIRIHSIAHHIGVRESRRVAGIDYIGMEAFEQAKKYPDGIAKVRYPIDIHNPGGSGTVIRKLADDEWYEIPYGCIVARDVSNLLIGGRPISVDHALHSSMRVMPSACSVGQAAGTAAAMAIETHSIPAQLDGAKVRARLREMGAVL
ncbi:MAG: FAD-dependent oxidoreductase [Victivallaceae bacterium]|nr:FAD-dependent oxidoreductase [Victivallaceae bacterium]